MKIDAPQPIKKILVANRGEIAIRVLRAASELGIRTVAIYTHEDRYSLHRYKADEAYQVGGDDDPLKPYLDIDEIIKLAKAKGVDGIHPGYGFLSENVDFARRCLEENIKFVGPSPETMDELGNKVKAKAVAARLDVPMIPSNPDPLTDSKDAKKAADEMGYPVMLKAASGGGGRGMRVVRSSDDIERQFNEAQREAQNAFGDGTIFIEKFIERPKHIEVQLLGDESGNLVHLFERDCSVQRRFQKVVEVAPAPSLSQQVKNKLYEYALRLGQDVGYYNAGTVEFLVEDEAVYFIEVNPRIQVEHTVTEEVTGIDIVRSQILIAMGIRLDHPQIYILNQSQLQTNGYAVQCRITTEDPKNGFMPDYGLVSAYRNAGGFGIRLDEGSSYPGVRISPFFDSMLVKVTAWGRTMKGASERLHRTLTEFRVRGVKTNIPFLQNLVRHTEFRRGNCTVKFIEENPELLEFWPSLDRGTRTLRYLADLIVNGNPDVKYVDPTKTFREPIIPDYDQYADFPKGTRDRLLEDGPDKFVEWLKNEQQIQYTDTTMRDAHQSLIATRVRTTDLLEVAEAFAKTHPEVFSMEVWGGATFDVCMRFLKESPWERLKLLRQAMPNICFQMLLRGSNGVGYKAYPDNLIEQFIEKSWETGIDIFRIFDSLNWVENMKVSINTVRERTGGIAEASICYTGEIRDDSRSKYTLQYYLDLAKELEDAGAHILAIKDMAGLLKPYSAELLISELKNVVDLPIHLHTHDTSGIQSATYLKAVEAGVDAMDVALAGMSGLTSQPNYNSLVASLQGTERENPTDLKSLNQFSNYWEVIREYYYPFESGLKAGTAEVYDHEIPGGQYSNLGPQVNALGLTDRWEEVKDNYKIVNKMLGDLIKVTPSSKVVGDLALFMTTQNLSREELLEKAESLSFPDSTMAFFRGEIGQPYGGFPKALQKAVLKDEKPYSKRANAHLEPVDFNKEFAAFREEFPQSYDELDFLSFKLYPKVFRDYVAFREEYGSQMYLPTLNWFYAMKEGDETLVEIAPGKRIIIRYLSQVGPDADGKRRVYFELNGQTRSIETLDRSVADLAPKNEKVDKGNPKHIGAPLQGKLSQVLVSEGDKVKKNQPVFIIEAMKMETNVVAPQAGTVKRIALGDNTLVQSDDLVVEME